MFSCVSRTALSRRTRRTSCSTQVDRPRLKWIVLPPRIGIEQPACAGAPGLGQRLQTRVYVGKRSLGSALPEQLKRCGKNSIDRCPKHNYGRSRSQLLLADRAARRANRTTEVFCRMTAIEVNSRYLLYVCGTQGRSRPTKRNGLIQRVT
jgi:hypothetical protein